MYKSKFNNTNYNYEGNYGRIQNIQVYKKKFAYSCPDN